MKRNHALIALAVTAIALNGCGHKKAGDAADDSAKPASDSAALPTVGYATVTVGAIERDLPVTGTLAVLPDRQATVTPPIAGVLDTLDAHVGQTVTRGQAIGHISTQQLTGQIEQAQATVAQNEVQVQQAEANALQQKAQTATGIAQAESALAQAKANLAGTRATLTGANAAVANAAQSLQRAQALERDGLIARKDVEAAQLALQTAQAAADAQKQTVEAGEQTVVSQQAALDAAKSASLQTAVKRQDVIVAKHQVDNALGALKTARSQLMLYTLRAPLSGTVTAVGASVGEAVDTSAKLASIANLGTLQLQIAIPADSVRAVHPGQRIAFTCDGYENVPTVARIATIGTQVDPASNTVQALTLVANPTGKLANGLFAKGNIVVERHSGSCLVPKSAILRDADGTQSVDVIGSDSVIHATPIQTGLTSGDEVEVLSGLKPGQRVATTGAYGLPDGTKVALAEAKP
jgi:RND family efflux transporter MFP subunit